MYFLADVPPKSGLYVHPEGPFTGSQLNQIPISFEKMKLSNSSSGPNGKILMLSSMLKYKPRIYLIQGKVKLYIDLHWPQIYLVNIDTIIENRPQKSTNRQLYSERFKLDRNGYS